MPSLFKRGNEAMSSTHLRRMVISAMFLAIALLIRTMFRMYIPIFGESGMRLSPFLIFSTMPAILFGPVYGAIVAGLTDFIGFHLSPTGAWIPQLTVTAFLGGFVRGGLWMLLRQKSTAITRSCVAIISVLILSIGIFNLNALFIDGLNRNFYDAYTIELSENEQGQLVRTVDAGRIDTTNMFAISRMAIVRSINMRDPAEGLSEFIMFVTTAMIGSGVFGLLLLAVDWAAGKYILKGQTNVPTMSLLLAMIVAGILVSTLNTAAMRTVLPAWQLLPFSVIWLPRVMQAVATTVIMTYFIAILLGICEKQPHLRQWLK